MTTDRSFDRLRMTTERFFGRLRMTTERFFGRLRMTRGEILRQARDDKRRDCFALLAMTEGIS